MASAAQPVVGAPSPISSNRKVWVLNRHTEDYTEEFRGEKITVPANNKKELLMPFLAARRFLAQPKAPAEVMVNGTFATPPKALYTQELTDEERIKIDGKTEEQLLEEAKKEEAEARQKHNIAMKSREKKVSVQDD